MKLHKLTATNFMPYKDPTTIDFPTDDDRNVMIVFGDNMRGKTSLMNALRWGFYGRAVGRHSRPIPLQEIVNRDAAAEDDWKVEVFITFESDGHKYELRRTATRRGHVATPSRPEDFIVATYLTRDGIVVSGDQVETEINQIAPEQISRFFLFDGELLQEYEELLIEGSEQGRQIKEAIEQVLGVPSLIHGRNELGSILKSATKKQSQEMSHIAGLERQAEQTARLTTRLDSFEEDLGKLTDKLNTTKQERSKLDEELEAAASILALKASLDGARDSLKTHNSVLEKKRADRLSLLSLAWQDLLDAKLEVKRSILRDKQKQLTDALSGRSRIAGQIKDIEKALATKECPTCKQDLHADKRAALGKDLGELEVALNGQADATEELQEISGQIATLSKVRGVNAHDRLVDILKEMRAAEVGAQRAENEIERIDELISGHDTADLARKRVLYAEKLKEEGRLTESINSVRRDIQKTKDELAIAQKAIEGLAPARSQRSTMKVSLAGTLERVFASSIERLRDRLRSQVEKLASESFKHLTTQKAYRGLEINANYGLSILDSIGRKVSLRSAGAEQIVALSLIDGLNRTGRAVGPVVMDTPFGRLDPKHRGNILAYLPTVTSQFVLLVHGGEINPDTDLAGVRSKIGAVYTIREISETQSKIERTSI